MKITKVRIRTIVNEVYRPFTNSLGTSFSSTREITIVEVETDEGITGVMGSMSIDKTVRQIILNQLTPIIVGQDPLNYERLWERMFGREAVGWRKSISKGEVVRALSVLDTAVWDIIGKKLQTPLYKLLGGYRDQVPCYASGGHYISLNSQADELKYLDSEMARYMEMGYTAVKMRVGRNIALDCERAKMVRDVIGPEVRLMMDFNTSASYHGGAPHAIKFMRVMEQFDPFWFEDPLVMDDIAGMKEITDAIDTAIATGENEQTIWGFRDLIVNKAVDILLPDATHMCGGITEWRKIAAMAEAFRMPVAAHIGDMVHIHCVASVPNGLIVEIFTPHDEGGRAHQLDPVFKPNKDGLLDVPQKPGIGIELNEDYISKHLVNQE